MIYHGDLYDIDYTMLYHSDLVEAEDIGLQQLNGIGEAKNLLQENLSHKSY